MEWPVCLDAFIKVAENLSFANAAKQLHTTSSSISKRIKWLEDQLGSQLLHRTTRSVALTHEGEKLLQESSFILEQWKNLVLGFNKADKEVTGILRIASAPYFGRMHVLPIIHAFQLLQPNLRVQYYQIDSLLNLSDQQIDIYFSIGHMIKDTATTVSTALTQDNFQCYASKKYLKKHGIPQTPKDLTRHRCVVMQGRKSWRLNNKIFTPKPYFTCCSSEALLVAVQLGMGIGFMPTKLIQSDAKKYHLNTVLSDYFSSPFKVYMSYSKQPFQPERLKLFLDFFLKNYKVEATK